MDPCYLSGRQYERGGAALRSWRLRGEDTARAAKCDPCCRPGQSHRIDESLAAGSSDEDPRKSYKGVHRTFHSRSTFFWFLISQPTRPTRTKTASSPQVSRIIPRCRSRPSPASWPSRSLPAPPPSTALCKCGTTRMPPAPRAQSSTQRARASHWALSTPVTRSPPASTVLSSNYSKASPSLPCSAVSLPTKRIHLILQNEMRSLDQQLTFIPQKVQLFSDAECKELVTDESQKCVTGVKSYKVVRL